MKGRWNLLDPEYQFRHALEDMARIGCLRAEKEAFEGVVAYDIEELVAFGDVEIFLQLLGTIA